MRMCTHILSPPHFLSPFISFIYVCVPYMCICIPFTYQNNVPFTWLRSGQWLLVFLVLFIPLTDHQQSDFRRKLPVSLLSEHGSLILMFFYALFQE